MRGTWRIGLGIVYGLSVIASSCFAASPLPSWTSPAVQGPQEKSTCSASAGFTFMLYIDKARSDTLVLEIPSGSGFKLPQLGPAEVSVAFAEKTLKASGTVHTGVLENNNLTADLSADVVADWIHQLTSGESATLSISGQVGEPAPISLRGSSAAIDAMERCIKADAFPAVPLPFRSSSNRPATHAEGCLRYGDYVTLEGTLVKLVQAVMGEDQTYAELRLPRPACVYRAAFQPFQPAVRDIEIATTDDQGYTPPAGAYGRPLSITGRLRDSQNKYEVESVLIVAAPSDVKLR